MDKLDKEICHLHRQSIITKIDNLEKKLLSAIKQAVTVSDMEHAGHKESLQSILGMIQEGVYEEFSKFENVEKKIGYLDKCIKNLEGELSFFIERKDDVKTIQELVTSLKLLKQAFETSSDYLKEDVCRTSEAMIKQITEQKEYIDKNLKYMRIALLIVSGSFLVYAAAPPKNLVEIAIIALKILF